MASGTLLQELSQALGREAALELINNYALVSSLAPVATSGSASDLSAGLLALARGGTAKDNTTTTYTPTLTNGANVSASTAYTSYFFRLGNYVHVWGKVDITHTATNTITVLNISLPVASTIGDESEINGSINGLLASGGQPSGRVYGDTGASNAGLWVRPVATSIGISYSFAFDYIVH